MAEYYDAIASGYNKLHGEEQMRKLRKFLPLLKMSEDFFVLDVGCGTGLALEELSTSFSVGAGIDPSSGLLEQVTSLAVKGGGEHLPFRDNTFDLVISLTALHHCRDPCDALREILRVGKNLFAFGLFKRSSNKAKESAMLDFIKIHFEILHSLDDQTDHLFILRPLLQSS